MTDQIALQLYSVREQLAQDFAATIRHIARMGYQGVEVAGLHGTSPERAAGLFKEAGLTVVAAHAPLPLGEQQNEVLETLLALGCRRLICAYLDPSELDSIPAIQALSDRLNEANIVARAHGLELGVHHHWWEFEPIPAEPGRTAHAVMVESLDPDIFFELDTYWIRTAGGEPVDTIRALGARAPLLHIKDGPALPDQPMVALGDGVMEIPSILEASAPHAEWLIVELDRCATDMLEAIARSHHYLTSILGSEGS